VPTALLAGSATAKPKPSSAPKPGTYSGDSIAGGKSATVIAKVTKKTAQVEIDFPAMCKLGASGSPNPTELKYKVNAPIKGKTFAFKGPAVDQMEILFGAKSTVTLNGRFTSADKFTGTASVKAPANETETEINCSAPTVQLKYELSIAQSRAPVAAPSPFAAAKKPAPIKPTVGEWVGTAKLSAGGTAKATAKVEKVKGALFIDPVVPATLVCGTVQIGTDVGFYAEVKPGKTSLTATDERLESSSPKRAPATPATSASSCT
jgi:hypothetical protein